MKDRFGNYIIVGWKPHEIHWVDAALTLPRRERAAAYRDIAIMSGRDFVSVRAQAYRRERKAMEDRHYQALKERRERLSPIRDWLTP